MSLLLATYRSTIVPSPNKPASSNVTSISPTASLNATNRGSAAVGQAPGGTPVVRTPSGAGAPQVRTPANNHTLLQGLQNTLGRTPSMHAGVNAATPVHTAHGPHTPAAAVHTPAGRTPARTPGNNSKLSRTPTSQNRDARRPGQMRAQIFFEKLLVAAATLVSQETGSNAEASRGGRTSGEGSARRCGIAEAFVIGQVRTQSHPLSYLCWSSEDLS